MDLSNRTVVVTGASRGLGAGIATECHRLGLKLGLCARSEPVLPCDERVLAAQLDVVEQGALDEFAGRVAQQFGHIDLWINNAGVLEPIKPLRDIDSEVYRQHLDINVLGVFNGTRAYIRHLRASGRQGVLINISSGAGRSAYYGWSAYCAAKAAVDRMTECVALEEKDAGIRVHAVAPGVIDTDMQAQIRSCTPDNFPLVDKFKELKRDEAFNTTEHVATELLALAFDPSRVTPEVMLDLRG